MAELINIYDEDDDEKLVGQQCQSCTDLHPRCSACKIESNELVCLDCDATQNFVLQVQNNTPTCVFCKLEGCLKANSDCDKCITCDSENNYSKQTDGSCMQCNVTNCEKCADGDSETCINCKTGLDGSNLIFNSALKVCESCKVNNCKSCATNDTQTCAECSPGYINDGGIACRKCNESMPNCEACSDLTTCSRCAPGYQLNETNTQCELMVTPNVSNCKQTGRNSNGVLDANLCAKCAKSFGLSVD